MALIITKDQLQHHQLSSQKPTSGDGLFGDGNLGGMIGGTGGQMLGSLIGPEGTIAGGGIGSGLGAGIQDLLQGRGINVGDIASNAALGAIPGGPEIRGIGSIGKSLLGREAIRAGAGFLGGAGSQTIRDVSSGKAPGADVLTTGGTTGALNALTPGLGKLLSIPAGATRKLGNVAMESANRILEQQKSPEVDAIKSIFGNDAVTTIGGRTTIKPAYQAYIQKHGITTSPGETSFSKQPVIPGQKQVVTPGVGDVKTQLQTAGRNTEKEVIKALENVPADYGFHIQPIVSSALKKVLRVDDTAKAISKLPADAQGMIGIVKDLEKNKNLTAADIRTAMLDVQALAKKVPGTPSGSLGSELESQLRGTVEDELGKSKYDQYKALMTEHKIGINARDTWGDRLKSKADLPLSLRSTALAKSKAGGQLGGERLKELAVHAAPALIGVGTNLFPLPDQVKHLGDAFAALYAAAEFGPHAAPEAGLKTGQMMQKQIPQSVQDALKTLLQQAGVHLPMAGQ